MMYAQKFSRRAVCLFALAVAASLSLANAQVQSGKVLVKAVHGSATFSKGADWAPLKESVALSRGATIKTAADSTVDLVLQYNGTVLRLTPNSTLTFEKLNKEEAGEGVITETSVKLLSGSIIGSQRKLATPSKFVVSLAGGEATIVGTEYLVRADGAVTVLSGSVKINYNLPGNGGSIKVTVPAGYSFNPATGQVVPTTAAFLQNIIADINTVRENAKVFKSTGGATVVVKPEGNTSPTKGKGNNGLGNGLDPQPPGDPPINDGPGTGPGNPGNKHHGFDNPRNPHFP